MTLSQFALFAQDDGGAAAAGGAIAGLILLIELAIAVLIIAGMWKVFVKAGKPGWAAIIPIYNIIVLLEIAGRPVWWILLIIVTCGLANIVVCLDIARKFGQGAGFGIGLFFLGPIFFPILGFGSAQYNPSA